MLADMTLWCYTVFVEIFVNDRDAKGILTRSDDLMRKTKIVCTIGPACNNTETLREMILSGMNVARLNFSHGDHEYHKNNIDMLKQLRDELQMPVAIMLDTKGPEIRVKSFENGRAELADGATFTFTTEDVVGNDKIVTVTYADMPGQLKAGDKILVDDGKIEMTVVSTTKTTVECSVICGGVISDNKGVNLPNVSLALPYLNERDKSDILFGIENDVDFIAASFVRSKQDVIDLRNFINYNGGHGIKIISKIENMEGVNNFDEILKYSDGIMVARGDLGVEIEYELLPGIQKRFILKCYRSGKMVITATQMLDSMINSPTPTRAEITDVANAVFDGTSAVMLSGETAAGKYPLLSVRAMAKIAEQAEKDAFEMKAYDKGEHEVDMNDTTYALCDAACTTARDINARAIIALTKSGQTARRMSKFRPIEPIIAATPDEKTYHQLALSWGVYPTPSLKQETFERLVQHAIDCAKRIDMVSDGDRVVVVAGVPLDTPGNTNIMKVELVKSEIG